mmetsp:Transcript_27134/g.53306  ORF Transcript_27134/g.53306 Transcript_27134/m.53306 type:complete len:96 (-) Transcript_27134:155-442(-)
MHACRLHSNELKNDKKKSNWMDGMHTHNTNAGRWLGHAAIKACIRFFNSNRSSGRARAVTPFSMEAKDMGKDGIRKLLSNITIDRRKTALRNGGL